MLVLRALGNERRLYILSLLAVRAYTGIELAAKLGIHKGAVSKHLHILLRAGLIVSRRKGGAVFFRLAPNFGKIIASVVDVLNNW